MTLNFCIGRENEFIHQSTQVIDIGYKCLVTQVTSEFLHIAITYIVQSSMTYKYILEVCDDFVSLCLRFDMKFETPVIKRKTVWQNQNMISGISNWNLKWVTNFLNAKSLFKTLEWDKLWIPAFSFNKGLSWRINNKPFVYGEAVVSVFLLDDNTWR